MCRDADGNFSHPPPQGYGWAKLQLVPTTPLDNFCVMTVITDGMVVPFRAADNERGLAAMTSLGERLLRCRIIEDYYVTYHKSDRSPGADSYLDPQYSIAQLVLSQALALHEGRMCVFNWARDRLGELMAG